MTQPRTDSRTRLLESALQVFREKGYAASSVDDVCARAGVTKGSFFHHFRSKEEVAVASVGYWNEWTGALFASAPYHRHDDPRDRVLAYVDFRASIVDRPVSEFTCLLGTLVQETYESHPDIRAACEAGLAGHVATLVEDIAAAKARHVPDATWTPESVAYYIQSVLQGSFIFAKAKGGPEIVRSNAAHLRHWLEGLLHSPRRHHRKENAA
jgi:TetR/AcrR family transcriptional repressor of nem operon